MERFTDDQVAEHVAEIMFDPLAEPEPECLLCQRASVLRIWQEWGDNDPFTGPSDGGEVA
jgi:hypothetical protein